MVSHYIFLYRFVFRVTVKGIDLLRFFWPFHIHAGPLKLIDICGMRFVGLWWEAALSLRSSVSSLQSSVCSLQSSLLGTGHFGALMIDYRTCRSRVEWPLKTGSRVGMPFGDWVCKFPADAISIVIPGHWPIITSQLLHLHVHLQLHHLIAGSSIHPSVEEVPTKSDKGSPLLSTLLNSFDTKAETNLIESESESNSMCVWLTPLGILIDFGGRKNLVPKSSPSPHNPLAHVLRNRRERGVWLPNPKG